MGPGYCEKVLIQDYGITFNCKCKKRVVFVKK